MSVNELNAVKHAVYVGFIQEQGGRTSATNSDVASVGVSGFTATNACHQGALCALDTNNSAGQANRV